MNALADPTIELHEPGNIVVTNDNWKDTQEPEIMATGIAPTNDLESAILATLDPGLYTAIVQGKNGGTGVGLVEVYDLDEAADSELANISTRGFVDIDENVMIGGFIVGNGVSTSVVVRAIGPSLSDVGVANPLQNPTLELFDSGGTQLAFDDDWKDSQQAEIEDAGLAPSRRSRIGHRSGSYPRRLHRNRARERQHQRRRLDGSVQSVVTPSAGRFS